MENLGDWPVEGLESVSRCPVCGRGERALLHSGLRDKIFHCAPGAWSLYRCSGCHSAYLDPRPDRASIGAAYQAYFTHQSEGSSAPSKVWNIFRAVRNGYLNRFCGCALSPASNLGAVLASLAPGLGALFRSFMRGLPPAPPTGRLLDVGCGNGDFLVLARSAGWDAYGVDFDAAAVSAAQSQGLNVVQGGIEVFDGQSAKFDAITLSHVVEHVHDPRALLEACFRLLKPGGYFWVETPNLDSLGHGRFGPAWRGLEPPRHLVLFNWDGLEGLLAECGFSQVRSGAWRPVIAGMNAASEAIEKDGDSLTISQLKLKSRFLALSAERHARRDYRRREFVTLYATKAPILKPGIEG